VKLFAAVCLLSAGVLSAQNVTISSVVAVGLGDASFSPGSEVYIYGSFPRNALPGDITMTVGDAIGTVRAVNSIGYVTAVIPFSAPLGLNALFLTYKGANTSAVGVLVKPYSPEFVTAQGAPVSDRGPVFPLANYYPLTHNDGNRTPVTPATPAIPGELLLATLTGLGPTDPPITANTTPGTFSPLATVPTMTLSGKSVNVTRQGNIAGLNEVDFVVPQDAPPNLDPLTLSIGGFISNTIMVPVGTQPDITQVLNGASFRSSGTVSAGSIVSIFGEKFGTGNNLSAFPATSVNGVSAVIGGFQAPIFALVAPVPQINVLVPTELPETGTVNLTVQSPSGASLPFPLTLAPAVPGIFFYTDPTLASRRNAVAVEANTAWLAMPTSMAAAMGLPQNCNALSAATLCGQPVHAGAYLQIYATGLGKATSNGTPTAPVLPSGTPAPANGSLLYTTVATPTVTIGGFDAPVLFSGIAPGYQGLYQVDVQIPLAIAPGSDVPLQIMMPGGVPDTATIAIQ
jgi:uncharacterized protein (TIGR03437 family)